MLISILILADSLFGNLTLERSKAQEDPLKLRIASLLFPHPPSLGLSRRLALGVPAQPLTPLALTLHPAPGPDSPHDCCAR